MTRRYSIAAGFGIVLLTICAFEAGRRTAAARLAALQERSRVDLQASPAPGVSPAEIRPIDIRLAPTASFRELFEPLRVASPEQRKQLVGDLTAMPKGPKQNAAAINLFKILIQLDAHEATELMSAITDRKLQILAIDTAIAAAPARALPELAKLIASIPEEDLWDYNTDFLRYVIIKWSAVDPVAASHFLEEYRGQERSHYAAWLVRKWAALDPEHAQDWIKQAVTALDGDENASFNSFNLMKAWLEGYFEYDRAAALDYALAHQEERTVREAIESFVQTLFLQSPDETRTLIERLDDPEAKASALAGASRSADGWKYHDGADARRSFDFVANWLLQFSPQAYGDSISSVMDVWRRRDREGLFAWITQLSDVQRSAVAANYPAEIGDGTLPEINRVAALPDRQLREQLLEGMMRHSNLRQDEVLKALDRATLSSDEKKRLRGLLPPQ